MKPIKRLDTENEQGFFRVLFVGDLHAGSEVSVKSPSFVRNNRDDGTRVQLQNNPIQDIFYSEWENMCKVIGHCNLVVTMGDMCDGVNFKNEGVGTWTTKMDEQIWDASNLLSMIDSDNFVGIKGSRYHIKDNMTADELVLKELSYRGKRVRWMDDEEVVGEGEYDELHMDYDMRLEIEELRFNLRHWLSTTKSVFMYRPTKIAREMLKLQTSIETLGEYDFVMRAHVHTYTYLDINTEIVGVTLPCWKGRDDLVRRSISDSASHGWFLMDIDGDSFTKYNRSFKLPINYNIQTMSFSRSNYKGDSIKHKNDVHMAPKDDIIAKVLMEDDNKKSKKKKDDRVIFMREE